MEKNVYTAPEAVVVEFDSDRLLSGSPEGESKKVEW